MMADRVRLAGAGERRRRARPFPNASNRVIRGSRAAVVTADSSCTAAPGRTAARLLSGIETGEPHSGARQHT